MMSAREQLLELGRNQDPYAVSQEDLDHLQLLALNEVLEEQRPRVPVLDHRAQAAGIDKVTDRADVVPLLFSHATYKSYPLSFLTKGQWDRMLLWYSTLAVPDVTDVDVSDVATADDFIGRLWDAGHHAYVTSGTTGKCSFLNHTQSDRELSAEMRARHWGWPGSSDVEQPLRAYRFTYTDGPMRGLDTWTNIQHCFTDTSKTHYLIGQPLRVQEQIQAGLLRQALVDGSARPSDIEQFRSEGARRAERLQQRFETMIDDIADHLAEPLLLWGGWARQWDLLQGLRSRGIDGRELDRGTVLAAGGGRKDPQTPADITRQVRDYYGDIRYLNSGYSMTEMSDTHRLCEGGRYHLLPWVMVLPLDLSGERLLEPHPEQPAVGRYAFVDISLEGRWGGLISGDQVEVSADRCPCGRPGWTILDSIERLGDADDDKITCGAAVDQYIRGVLEV